MECGQCAAWRQLSPIPCLLTRLLHWADILILGHVQPASIIDVSQAHQWGANTFNLSVSEVMVSACQHVYTSAMTISGLSAFPLSFLCNTLIALEHPCVIGEILSLQYSTYYDFLNSRETAFIRDGEGLPVSSVGPL